MVATQPDTEDTVTAAAVEDNGNQVVDTDCPPCFGHLSGSLGRRDNIRHRNIRAPSSHPQLVKM